MPRSRTIVQRTPSRRGMDWAGGQTGAVISLAPNTFSAGYIVSPSTIRTEYTDPTLVRTRGMAIFGRTQAGFIAGAIGIIDWPDVDDVTPAAADIPLPASFADMDWIWYKHLLGQPVVVSSQLKDIDIEIDSKAMRRLGNRKGILLVVQSLAISTATFTFGFGARCLLKDG